MDSASSKHGTDAKDQYENERERANYTAHDVDEIRVVSDIVVK